MIQEEQYDIDDESEASEEVKENNNNLTGKFNQ